MDDPAIVVAYLARREEGLPAFERFIASYRRHPAGRGHALVLLRKGFAGAHADAWGSWAERLAGLEHGVHPVPESGFDLGAYRSYLAAAPGRTVLFLNSHSELLVDGWLDLMARHSRPGVLVGATGSWESHRSNLREPYAPPAPGIVRGLRRGFAAFRAALAPERSGHPPFPNPAVRTNAFLLPPDLHGRLLAWPVPATKEECHRLESGNAGLSRAVVAAGGTLRIAGADGRAHDPLAWPAAGLFRSDGQRNLIIADNQTRRYDSASTEERSWLGWCAWRSFHSRIGE